MNHLDGETLAGVALGDISDDQALAHVAACSECRAEIESFQEVLDVTRELAGVPLVPPPVHLWSAIEAEIAADDVAAPDGAAPDGAAGDVAVRRATWQRSWPRLAAAAAVGVLVGGGLTAAVLQGRDTTNPPTPSMVTLAAVNLDTLDTTTTLGKAMLVRTASELDLDVEAPTLTPAADGYLEVWLINKDLKRMVSIGVLPSGTTRKRFVIPQSLIDQGYVVVDISRESFDDQPAHSGESLVRGTLQT